MTLTIELTAESVKRLNQAAERAGLKPEDFARCLIENLPTSFPTEADGSYTARKLLTLSLKERECYLQAAAERATLEYEADLALPAAERELTAFSATSGADFQVSAPHD